MVILATMKYNIRLLIILLLGIFISCNNIDHKMSNSNNTATIQNVIYAGARSSSYGIRPFPDPVGWQKVLTAIQNLFEGSTPCAIWIVGTMHGDRQCRLEFPSDRITDPNIVFLDYDKHEPFLQHFDNTGIKVFLQVEPANAQVMRLIDLVLNRYKQHPCVIGFGIDVEWFREADNPDWGAKVNDDSAKTWEQQVKSINPSYSLFLKHWDRDWMPPAYRGDLIFVSDSQGFNKLDDMLDEFITYWADYFKPNRVFYQFGYRRDKSWWSQLNNPPADIGTEIAHHISQNCGIFWVDFTLRDIFPDLE
jgi:hypothetical protein